MKLAEFILYLLKQQNIRHIFGVPGDYNLGFLDYIEADPNIQWIGACNELNASYAADGYARENGFGVLVTTHGVGELSVVNGIAGSYAENVPVLHIVGYPSTASLEGELPIHHTLAHGDKSNFLSCFDQISCSHSILSKANFVDKLLRTISKMLLEKKPGVIGLPCNLLSMEVDEQITGVNILTPNMASSLIPDELIAHVVESFTEAKHPVLLLGSDIKNFQWTMDIKALVDKLNIPFATSFMGKGILSEQDNHFIGMYAGSLSYPDYAKNAIENADCIISIGTRKTDFTSGGFSDKYIHQDKHLVIKPQTVRFGKQYYENIHIPTLLKKLTEALPSRTDCAVKKNNQEEIDVNQWNQNNFWPYVAKNIIEPGDIVAAEAGTSLFGLLWQRLPDGVSLISQILWASIGFTLPAIFGATLSQPKKRGVLIIGDGSSLFSIQELSSMVRYQVNVLIILINNNGYTVERAIHGAQQSYNDTPKWDYQIFAKAIGIKSPIQVKSFEELEKSIGALKTTGPQFVECIFEENDVPLLLARIAENVKNQNK